MLLDFSRLQSGKLELNRKIYDLKVADINGDDIALDRIITNLLINASKYSKPKTKIELILKKTKQVLLAYH